MGDWLGTDEALVLEVFMVDIAGKNTWTFSNIRGRSQCPQERKTEKRERQEIRYLVRESKDRKNSRDVLQVALYFKTRDSDLRGLAPA